jgi:uncharacterized protein
LNSSRPDERGSLRGWLGIPLAFLGGLGLALLWFHFRPPAPPPTPVPKGTYQGEPDSDAQALLRGLNGTLESLDLLKLAEGEPQSLPATLAGKVVSAYRENFRLPEDFHSESVGKSLGEAAASLGARVLSSDPTGRGWSFGFEPGWTAVQIQFLPVDKPRICLIIDDGGYQKGEALQDLYGFKVPVTVSIIPDVRYSRELAEAFPEHGVEVMCHLPMEGHEKVAPGDYKEFLRVGMPAGQIRALTSQALDALPNCRGLNNHMGSLATADPDLVQAVCSVLKERHLFVIDSRTTARTVVEKTAKEDHLPVARRNVFLDDLETPGAILAQMDQLAARARRDGLAVGIGHFKLTTLKTLEEAVHRLRDQGFQFVYASEAVREE